MADYRTLTVQSGIATQIQDANSIIVGSGIKTSAGNLAITAAGGTVTFPSAGGIEVTGVIKGPVGSASAPSYSFISDPDTGLYIGPNGGIGFSDETLALGEFFALFGAWIIQSRDHGIVIQTVRTTDGVGFDILLQIGAAQGAGPSAGGNVKLIPGAGVGGGANGKVLFRDTSDGVSVATMDDTGRLLVGAGTAALPSIGFLSAPTVGFFLFGGAVIGVSIGGANALLLSLFGAGLLIAPDRPLTIFPQRQTSGVGDVHTIAGGSALGGANAGGNLDLACGIPAGAGAPGVINIKASDLTTINASFNNAGDFTHTNGDASHARKTMTLVNGVNNNVANTAGVFFKVSGPTAVFSINGFVAGTDGQEIEVLNLTAFAMTINHENAGSTAANRVTTLTGSPVATVGSGFARLRYDTSISRWILLAPTA